MYVTGFYLDFNCDFTFFTKPSAFFCHCPHFHSGCTTRGTKSFFRLKTFTRSIKYAFSFIGIFYLGNSKNFRTLLFDYYYEFCLHVKIFINHNNFFLKMKDTIYTHYNNFGKLK